MLALILSLLFTPPDRAMIDQGRAALVAAAADVEHWLIAQRRPPLPVQMVMTRPPPRSPKDMLLPGETLHRAWGGTPTPVTVRPPPPPPPKQTQTPPAPAKAQAACPRSFLSLLTGRC